MFRILCLDGGGIKGVFTAAVLKGNLARLYENGWGLSQDTARARDWYGKAAKRGSEFAVERLIAIGRSEGAPSKPHPDR
jgi:TPR repeat protein